MCGHVSQADGVQGAVTACCTEAKKFSGADIGYPQGHPGTYRATSSITATAERLRGHLACNQASPEEKSHADSNRTATESRPWHYQSGADATRLCARSCTAETTAGT